MTSASCYRTPVATPSLAGTTLAPVAAAHPDSILLPSTQALMPGVVNSTFTPNAGVMTATEEKVQEEEEEEDSDDEPPKCIPVSKSTHKRRHSAMPFVSHATAFAEYQTVVHDEESRSRRDEDSAAGRG